MLTDTYWIENSGYESRQVVATFVNAYKMHGGSLRGLWVIQLLTILPEIKYSLQFGHTD